MAALSAFYPLIAPRVPGAPAVAISAAALEGAIEFCARTLTLQRKLTAVTTVANQAAYTLTQAGEVVEKLLAAKLAGQPLRLPVQADLDEDDDETLSVSAPGDLLLTGTMQVTLTPPPAIAGQSLVVRAAMRPTQAATTVDDVLFERHAQAIADWALHKLKSASKETTYYDAKGSDLAMQRFIEAVGREKTKVLRERARSKARPRVLWC
jgi:hypothetical protein